MATEKVVYKNNGIGVFGLLGVLFVALKLTGYITWSWWLVLLPFYGFIALVLAIGAIAILVGMIIGILN